MNAPRRHDGGGWIAKAGFPPAASAQPHRILRLQDLGFSNFVFVTICRAIYDPTMIPFMSFNG